MSSTVTYAGPKDPTTDNTTEIDVEVDGRAYVFPQGRVGGVRGEEPGPVPKAVVERLEREDLAGHIFDFGADSGPANPADGTIEEVLERVGESPDQAREALEAERAKQSPRSTLVEQLEARAGETGSES